MTRPKSPLRKYLPPIRRCRECDATMRSWSEAPLCGDCVKVKLTETGGESMRDYRRRVIDPERNGN